MADQRDKERDVSALDIPGANITSTFEAATVAELKRWLQCRNASTGGRKKDLIER